MRMFWELHRVRKKAFVRGCTFEPYLLSLVAEHERAL